MQQSYHREFQLRDACLGVPSDTGIGLPLCAPVQMEIHPPYGRTKECGAISQLAFSDYKPGVYTFSEKRGTPDWENLRTACYKPIRRMN